MKLDLGGHTFELEREMIDVTMAKRPDTTWRFVDPAGHEHRWHRQGSDVPAEAYDPGQGYVVPTVVFIVDGTDEDGIEYGHQECTQCRARVRPGTTSDDCRQYVPGLIHCRIDGRTVDPDEFKRRAAELGLEL